MDTPPIWPIGCVNFQLEDSLYKSLISLESLTGEKLEIKPVTSRTQNNTFRALRTVGSSSFLKFQDSNKPIKRKISLSSELNAVLE